MMKITMFLYSNFINGSMGISYRFWLHSKSDMDKVGTVRLHLLECIIERATACE